MIAGRWELFPHGADMGVRGIGSSKEEAFEQVAVALTAVITDPTSVLAKECIEVSCEAPDDELLLVNWLNALIYEIATRKMLFARFEVSHRRQNNCVQRRGVKPSMWPSTNPQLKLKGRLARVSR